MAKNMRNEMETGIIQGFYRDHFRVPNIVGTLSGVPKVKTPFYGDYNVWCLLAGPLGTKTD